MSYIWKNLIFASMTLFSLKFFIAQLLIISCFFQSFSQNISISGSVIDDNKQAVAYANVFLLNSQHGSITNIEGKFEFSITDSLLNDTLIISSIGFIETKIPLKNHSTKKPIILPQYIKTFDEVTIEEKRTDPIDVLIKAFYNLRNCQIERTYYTNIFFRYFLTHNNEFVFYRRTLAETETERDDLWFNKGNIIADEIINSNKIPVRRNRMMINSGMIFPPIDYQRSVIDERNLRRNININIDTVIFNESSKIFVIDIFPENFTKEEISLIKSVLNKAPIPYTMLFNKEVQELARMMLNNNKYAYERLYIDANNEFTIIKKILIGKTISGIGAKEETFIYYTADFNNEFGNSYPTRVLSFKMNITEHNNGTVQTNTSLLEAFAYNQNPDKVIDDENELDLNSQYFFSTIKAIRNNLPDINTWQNHEPYIKTDSLQEFAINQILTLKHDESRTNRFFGGESRWRRNNLELPDISLHGFIIDSLTKEPLEFCNIVFKDIHADNKILGAITNTYGEYKISVPLGQVYRMEISKIGYSPIIDTLDFYLEGMENEGYHEMAEFMKQEQGNLAIDVGTFKLSPTVNMLGEVEIKEEGSSFEFNKQSVIVTNELREHTISAKDVLHKISGLNYDYMRNNLSVDNDKNVKVLIDGVDRPNEYILNLNPKRIRRVEITRDITGIYRMEGYNSIVNIITHDNYRGYDLFLTGNLMDNFNKENKSYFKQNSANLSLDITRDKWSFYFKTAAMESENAMYFSSTTQYPQTDMRIESYSTDLPNSISEMSNYSFSFSSDYRINRKHTLGAGVSARGFPATNHSTTLNFDSIINPTDKFALNTEIASITESFRYSGNINYHFNINRSSHLSAYLTQTNNTSELVQNINNSEVLKYKRDFSNLKFNANYQNTINNKFTISNGLSYIENSFTSKNNDIKSTNFYSKLRAFTDFAYRFNSNLNLALGTSFESYNNRNDEADYTFNSFQPHISLNSDINKKHKLSLRYQINTEYPFLTDLIPQIQYLSAFEFSRGNPNLKPFNYHNFSLEYRNIMKSVLSSFSLRPYYKYSNNMIAYRSFTENETDIIFTKDNYVNYEKTGIRTGLNFEITKKLNADLDIDIFHERNINLETPEFVDYTGSIMLNYNFRTSNYLGFSYQKDRYFTVNSQGYSQEGLNYFMIYFMTMQLKGRMQLQVMYSLPWLSNDLNKSYEETPSYIKETYSDVSFMNNMIFVNISFRFSNGKVHRQAVKINEETMVRDEKNIKRRFD
jgi:hypothetical protein